MEIKEITNKEVWENFFLLFQEKTFLQSWNWGEVQKGLGNKIWRLGFFEKSGGLSSAVLAVKIRAKRGTFLLVPHGPIIINPTPQILKEIVGALKNIAKKEGVSFIRVASLLERSEENKKIFRDLGFRNSPMHTSAYEATWKLDITLSEEEILKNMRKTTHYLINQALKNSEIEIAKSNKIEDVEIYQNLNKKVAQYQKFIPFSFELVKNEFTAFNKDNQALFFFGKSSGRVIAAALVIFWSRVGFYHQAALDPEHRKIPIAYLLQWEAIKEVKKRGCKIYDFWGYVDPKSKHPWSGPTLFKMGFGGYKKEYLPSQDLPLSSKYWLTYFFEKLRKFKRGL